MLSAWERLGLGALVERRMDEARYAKARRDLERQWAGVEEVDVASAQRALQSVPIKLRQRRARDPAPLGKGDSKIDQLLDDARAEVETLNEFLKRPENARVFSAPLKRLDGERPIVLKEAAEEASKKFGKKISVRMAQQAWDEYRAQGLNDCDDSET
jgi:hypothetical protein